MADEVADAERKELAGVAHHHQYAVLGRRVDAEPVGGVLQDWILLVNSPRGPFGRNPGKLERAGKVSSGRWATLVEFAKSIGNGTENWNKPLFGHQQRVRSVRSEILKLRERKPPSKAKANCVRPIMTTVTWIMVKDLP